MVYTLLTASLVIIALLIILVAAQLLLRGSWLLAWLRGMSGIIALGLAALLVMAALDFYSYQQLSKEENVASLSFTQVGDQHFKVSLVDANGAEDIYEIKGDLWQLDARVLKWNPSLAALGLTAGYRLDRLSGRYLSLEQEKTGERTIHSLSASESPLDIWSILNSSGRDIGLLDAEYGSATFLPMADKALFTVTMSNTGLLARPLNDPAIAAVRGWQ